MRVSSFKVKEILMGAFDRGDDLLLSLKSLCKEKNIKAGKIEVLGSVEEANVGYYYKKAKEFRQVKYRKSMEIVACQGTITLKDGEPFIHCHISLSDHDGDMYGGHLAEGTILFSSEFMISIYEGQPIERVYDEETGLPLLK